MTKVKVNKNSFYTFNVNILGITVSMWKQHDFETIFSSNDVMNIQDGIG